ncbi:hypothetical protein BDV37DRAFT_182084 [Aspergillus pseudonomiae]|uniref:Uncharacterized protein n=1 Tax=Aspergillus pseudonomiae TaxID=1506151 RepID=A0A5N7D5K1_9EURO|nr:uncharacterized protein BDV37DRAFT_182084 [Aspergillus pseudonomiae]KAE8401427.1 hypothetical protein BDV37DRAFT_182084 [Aspergillus pseudonomiae]
MLYGAGYHPNRNIPTTMLTSLAFLVSLNLTCYYIPCRSRLPNLPIDNPTRGYQTCRAYYPLFLASKRRGYLGCESQLVT